MENSDIIIRDSGKAGPTLAIIGGVHGNEPCGIKAIAAVKDEIKPKKGKIIYIIANKEAIKENKRFIEKDLNRSFDSKSREALEERTAQDIKPYLQAADAMLDIHASRTPDTERFIICEQHSIAAAKNLAADKILIGIDEFHGGSTDAYMNKQGKVGICIECGWNEDEKTTKAAKESIKAFCAAYGLIEETKAAAGKKLFKAKMIYKNTTESFTPAKPFKDFEKITKGITIGHDGIKQIIAQKDAHILFCRSASTPGEECFLLTDQITG